MMANRPEFRLCDTAAMHLGAAPFSVYNTSPPPPQIAHVFGNAGNRVVICEARFLDTVRAAGGAVEHIVCLDDTEVDGGISPAELEDRGAPDLDFGTVGPSIPGPELRAAEDGELLARGETVMRGYRQDPEKTAEAVDADGWMHSGDVAEIDAEGYVRIVDGKKELIINAAGKNMSPADIEAALMASSPLIGQAVAVGDRRPYNVALIVLDPGGGASYARTHGLPDASAAALSLEGRVRDEVPRPSPAPTSSCPGSSRPRRSPFSAPTGCPAGTS